MNMSSTAKSWELSRATTLVPSIASWESHPDTLPSDQAAQELDPSSVAEIDKCLKRFRPFLKPKSQLRVVFGIALKSSGSTLASSGASGNRGAASTTFAELSVHLEQILEQTEGKPIGNCGQCRSLKALARSSNGKRQPPFLGFPGKTAKTHFEWQLIKQAALASKLAYEGSPDIIDGQHFKAKGKCKAMIMYIDEVDSRKILTIAVRGTVTKDDWMLNVNSSPKKSSKMLLETATWHGGFLAVAEAMAKPISKAISDLRREHEDVSSILFAGHSAGGAVAQVLYAMSMSPDMILSKEILGKPTSVPLQIRRSQMTIDFHSIHCITFGTPPVTSVPLHQWPVETKRPGNFLSIVNEGDPVAQAQEEFIKTLVDVYALSPKDLESRYPDGVVIPQGRFRASGHTVILKDAEPDDLDSKTIEIHTTESHLLEKKLFGNPLVHPMKEYLARVEGLTDLGEEEGKVH
ncbi:MAG: hypothetical protein Q9204_006618 [Flavoplaca sp. TL-2023a]